MKTASSVYNSFLNHRRRLDRIEEECITVIDVYTYSMCACMVPHEVE